MEFFLTSVIKAFLFPPGIFVVLLVCALWLLKRNIVATRRLIVTTAASIYLLSTPIVSELLITPLESYPPLDMIEEFHNTPQAIVILTAGRNRNAPEYGNFDVSGDKAFGRIRYGAKLHRITSLPVLVTGGLGDEHQEPLAEIMARDLKNHYQVKTKWLETKSSNTAENARFSYDILRKEGISRIYLVTHASHLTRAVPIFEHQGFDVTPAPTQFMGFSNNQPGFEFDRLIPNSHALIDSYFALHEYVGVLWYKIRY